MSVSVIVPNYNHLKFLPERLDSIFNQSFQDFEVILLDDCSSDGSWEYLETFKNHPKVSHCIRNEKNSGSPFIQWKKGMDLARFDWIWIAESDDFSDLAFLQNTTSKMEEGVSLIFSKSHLIDSESKFLMKNGEIYKMDSYDLGSYNFKKNGLEFIRSSLIYRNYILNASAALFKKKEIFPNSILSMKFAGDWIFWIDILIEGDVVYLPDQLNYFRYHSTTTRVSLDEKMELNRFKEGIECMYYAKNLTKQRFTFWNPDNNFGELVKEYFKLRLKFGRLRFYSIFPKIPFFLYLLYYSYFINSFLPTKLKYL